MDLHSTNIVICVVQNFINSKTGMLGVRVLRRKVITLSESLEELIDFLTPYCNAEHAATVESTYNWYRLADLFEERGWNLVLADPTTVKFNKEKATNDMSDAEFLANQLRLGHLHYAKILPKASRGFRDLLRMRGEVVKERARYRTILKNLFNNYLYQQAKTSYLDNLSNAYAEDPSTLDGLFGDPNIEFKIGSLLLRLRGARMEVERIEKRVIQLQSEMSEKKLGMIKRLQTIKGCGFVLSNLIAAEIDDIARFKSAGNFISYCRLAPTSRISNAKVKGEGNGKNGNAYLRWAMTELANLVIQFNPEIKATYQRLLNKSKLRVKAVRTISAKLARAIWYMLKNEEDFDVRRSFFR